jgi:hypothetical protein
VAFARTLLADFEASLPSLADSVSWLLGQLAGLGLGLNQIEAAAQQVVTATVTGLTAVFSGFVGFILNYLPFQIGDRATSTLTITQTVLAGLPTLITETETKIGGTLAPRLSASEAGWQHTLVRPLREKTLSPAEKILASLHDTHTLYRAQVQMPPAILLTGLGQTSILRQVGSFQETVWPLKHSSVKLYSGSGSTARG